MPLIRWPLLVAMILGLSGCISGIDYGKVQHAQLSAGAACNPVSSDIAAVEDKPFFFVTSRLPDCFDGEPTLTGFRADHLRYGRHAEPTPRKLAKARGQSQTTPLTFQAKALWWQALERTAKEQNGRVLVYVHGFRETFLTSARDTAQIAELTGFSGPVIQYSWPSQGKLLGYAVDEASMKWDERNFRMFLRDLAAKQWVKDIVLVTHSLGARLVLPAVEYVDNSAADQNRSGISNIILASPDTDRRQFERDIETTILSPARVKAGRRLTIYLSAKDKANALSRTLHGYPRLGNPYCFDPFEAAKLEERGLPQRCYPDKALGGLTIIDTSDVKAKGNGHSDYLRSATACLDFARVVDGESGESRIATHLPHVFTLKPYAKSEKPDHDAICHREPR